MSLYTNREALEKCQERDPDDHYPTPMLLVQKAVEAFLRDYSPIRVERILDIGCGDRRWLHALRSLAKPINQAHILLSTNINTNRMTEASPKMKLIIGFG